MHNLTQLDTI
uniref:Uncharacterized protein n=1 Tax=Anguilla anguilla TaxID=7936 RepID=A0A0E9TK78_ANGAN